MKQTFTFYSPVIASNIPKRNQEAYDLSIETFENGEYVKSLHILLDSIDKNIRIKYGNPAGNEFRIPHGPVVILLKQKGKKLFIKAPFVHLPEQNRIAIMRQIAGINFEDLDLAKLTIRENQCFFEYECPLNFSHPSKIYYVLEEICRTASRYDYKFHHQFKAERASVPCFMPYSSEKAEYVYQSIRQSCNECLDLLKQLEPLRKFNAMRDVIALTVLKIIYTAQPQGELLDTLQRTFQDTERNIPVATIVTDGKRSIREIREVPKEKVVRNLYQTETFIPDKGYSNLQNIRDNYENCYKQVSAWMESGNYRDVCIRLTYKFYEIYYDNHVQESLDLLLKKALDEASGHSWQKAATTLYQALDEIMQAAVKTAPRLIAA